MSAGDREPDLGGSVVIQGPGRTWGIVHVGPEPGACSVDDDGCGYCFGPCRSPASNEDDQARLTRSADA